MPAGARSCARTMSREVRLCTCLGCLDCWGVSATGPGFWWSEGMGGTRLAKSPARRGMAGARLSGGRECWIWCIWAVVPFLDISAVPADGAGSGRARLGAAAGAGLGLRRRQAEEDRGAREEVVWGRCCLWLPQMSFLLRKLRSDGCARPGPALHIADPFSKGRACSSTPYPCWTSSLTGRRMTRPGVTRWRWRTGLG